jgi:hypothetical protein
MFIARTMLGVMKARVETPCAPVAVCRVSRKVTSSFEWSWTISVNVNEGTHNHDSRTPYISLVTTLFTVYAQWTPVHLTWGLLRACAACLTPHLNLMFELRPSWNYIHDTFPIGTAQDTTISSLELELVKVYLLTLDLSYWQVNNVDTWWVT